MRYIPHAVAALAILTSGALAQPDGGYLELDGIDDSVTASGNFITPELTIEAWVRPDTVHPDWTAGIVSYGAADRSSFDFGIGPTSDPRLRFFINWNQGQKTIVGINPLQLGEWHHVAVTYDGSMARLYIDGEFDNEKSFDQTPILPSGADALFAIGDDIPGASEFIGGGFDEVRIWNFARSQAEIQADMNAALTGDEPGLFAYYPLDECGSQAVLDHSTGARHARRGRSLAAEPGDPTHARHTPTRTRCLTLTSSREGTTLANIGTIQKQLDRINAGPPADGYTPIVNRHADLHVRDQFPCGENLDRSYVDSETFLTGADEVTLDNCVSAFYRFEFELPPVIGPTAVYGAANADDLGTAYMNGRPISPLLVIDDVNNLGQDRASNTHPLLNWPTADVLFEIERPTIARAGLNTLTFGVCSDASEFEPAGLEFELIVEYECVADWNVDGENNTIDFTAYLNDWNARLPEADLNGDGAINTLDVLVWLNIWTFGCPG